MTKAVLLLSGGLDSVVSYACLKDKYEKVLALTFDYKQKPLAQEIKSANEISKFYGIENKVIKLDWLGDISNSALNKNQIIPELDEIELNNKNIIKEASKSVYVPNRNAVFINIAACFAEALNYNDIIIGANREEGETFKDNSLSFINSINNMLRYSINSKVNVIAPLSGMNKEETVKKGIELNIPFKLLYSCYNGKEKHCGKCESCIRLIRALKSNCRYDILDSLFREGK